jgi:hypothetical protein
MMMMTMIMIISFVCVQDSKWKMYVELDGDDDSDVTALSLVHDVAFTCRNPAYGTFCLSCVSIKVWVCVYFFLYLYFVFCNIFVTGFPVKFWLLSPGRAWQQQCCAYPGHWGNRTLSMVEETGVPGGNHRYVIRAENSFYTVQHI